MRVSRLRASVSIIIASILVGALAPLPLLPMYSAEAVEVVIETSADSHGGTFFGHGVLQVVVTDPNADDDDLQEILVVDIDADADSGTADSDSFEVFETSQSSGRFEFFLVHVDSDFADGVGDTVMDPINPNGFAPVGVESLIPDAEASIITFGPGGNLDTGAGSILFTNFNFDIDVGSAVTTIDYEEAAPQVTTDRSTYGSTSIVYLHIQDQDPNEDPTAPDSFIVTSIDLNNILFDLSGASFNGTATFEETGDNTADFEASLQLATSATPADDELVISSESVTGTLNDRANYEDVTGAENTSTDTDDFSFDIDDVDGDLGAIGTVTFGSELSPTITDNDANVDSQDEDSIVDALLIMVDNPGGDTVAVDLEETDDNTGMFLPDTADNEILITFINDAALTPAQLADDIVQLRPDDITADLIIAYNDTLNDDSSNELFETTIEMTLFMPQASLPDSAGIDDDFVFEVTDADLNDNASVEDTYSIIFDGAGPYPLVRGSQPLSELATFEVEIEGDPLDFDTPLAFSVTETDVNTGKFNAVLDMGDIIDSANVDVDDGDELEIEYNDLMDEIPHESSDLLTIGVSTPPPPGEDRLFCGKPASHYNVIVGTPGNDNLVGTSGADLIRGLSGNDKIDGNGGNDCIKGGAGQDVLSGGSGKDSIRGGIDNDQIDGGEGDDRLSGGKGNDEIRGRDGNDRLFDGKGDDNLFGGNGNDECHDTQGTDTLVGCEL